LRREHRFMTRRRRSGSIISVCRLGIEWRSNTPYEGDLRTA
jgi:hypothetical protein